MNENHDTPDTGIISENESESTDGATRESAYPDTDPAFPRSRDERRRYLAKIGKLSKERDRLVEALQSRDTETERLVDERIRAYESERARETERHSFFSDRPDAAEIESDLESLRETFPAMSWNDAYVFHTARHAPEKLVDQRLLAQKRSRTLDTSAYAPNRLRAEPDVSSMSAAEYGRHIDALIAGGKISL
ncbi:MAG TPA: hypothetical protein PK765_00380 [bacterium]|nr:hypothetical protein [bacterium]